MKSWLILVGATCLSSWKGEAFVIPTTILSATNNVATFGTQSSSLSHGQQKSMQIMPPLMAVDVTKSEDEDNGSTMDKLIFNLVKNIVGAGVLSLPSGIAAFGNAPSAVIPAIGLIGVIGTLSAYGFSLIGRICANTGSSSYREAWEKSVGKSTSIIPAASCIAMTLLATITYSMILGDTFQALFSTAGLSLSRSTTLLSITATTLLPLCLLNNLSALAPFSLLGIFGMGYTAIAMAIRYFTKCYAVGQGSFLADLPIKLQPSFGIKGAASALSPSSLIFLCMLSTSFVAHFNAPKFYNELKNNTVKRFNTVVYSSFSISVAIFSAIASMGFLTFGGASNGLILNNYSNKDMLMCFSRVAVAISIIFSYPLAFVGCRDGILDLANVPTAKRSKGLLNKLTACLLSIITVAALSLKDLSFVMSLGGATLGNALIYVYPALMFRSMVKAMGDNAGKGLKREVIFSNLSAVFGTCMGVIGTKMAFKAAF